jgi:hypothetical protein
MAKQAIRLPSTSDRTFVIGRTGSGKTTALAWLFSKADFVRVPWVVYDFKRDRLFSAWLHARIASPLPLTALPPNRGGIFIVRPNHTYADSERLEDQLWKILRRENIGIWGDEVADMPNDRHGALKSLLSQGRSKNIPMLMGNQRPVDVNRSIISEASFLLVFRLADERDRKTVRGVVRATDDELRTIPEFTALWYDVARDDKKLLRGIPTADISSERIADRVPHYFWA